MYSNCQESSKCSKLLSTFEERGDILELTFGTISKTFHGFKDCPKIAPNNRGGP